VTTMTAEYEPITLLNATYERLSANVSLQRAARLLALGKAVIEEADESGRFLRHWPWPKVIRLVRYVKLAYDKLNGPPMVSKRGVLLRDHNLCAYCGEYASTVDHVQPKSRGGGSTWLNQVAACRSCNNKKANRTPDEAGMRLRVTPYVPKRKF
jgi:hypothetical protein